MKTYPRLARLAAIVVAGGTVAACLAQPPVAVYGTPTAVAVRYYDDLGAATDVARQYCAQYGRTAQYVGTTEHVGEFECTAR